MNQSPGPELKHSLPLARAFDSVQLKIIYFTKCRDSRRVHEGTYGGLTGKVASYRLSPAWLHSLTRARRKAAKESPHSITPLLGSARLFHIFRHLIEGRIALDPPPAQAPQ